MGDLFLLSERQMPPISPFFPLSHGVMRVDDRRVVSGIVYAIRNGLQWKDAPKDWRRIATRYDRCAHAFFSAVCIAAAVIFRL